MRLRGSPCVVGAVCATNQKYPRSCQMNYPVNSKPLFRIIMPHLSSASDKFPALSTNTIETVAEHEPSSRNCERLVEPVARSSSTNRTCSAWVSKPYAGRAGPRESWPANERTLLHRPPPHTSTHLEYSLALTIGAGRGLRFIARKTTAECCPPRYHRQHLHRPPAASP